MTIDSKMPITPIIQCEQHIVFTFLLSLNRTRVYTVIMYISELIIDFIEYVDFERGRSQKTAENYHLYLQRLVEFGGDVEIDKITSEVVCKYRLWLNRYNNEVCDELSTITQRYHLIPLPSFLT